MPWDRSKGRDPRLDFFRGLAMFIIFIAHVRGNILTLFIPARFGPSDATELFVFCSGYASAIAFGGIFNRLGFWTGISRTLLRVWQIYWAHVSLFFTIATLCVVATWLSDSSGVSYIEKLNLTRFFTHTEPAMVGLFTLTYVPNLFDILPMYMVALLLLPIMILLRRIHLIAAIGLSISLYSATWLVNLELPADPWTSRPWFFNPFAWQLLFFTAFALGAGWISAPKPQRWLLWAAVIYVIIWIPISFWPVRQTITLFSDLHAIVLAPLMHGSPKTDLHLFRYIHILCLGYIVICLLWERETLLLGKWAKPIIKVGQQALPTFMASIVLSWCGGVLLDHVGRSAVSWISVNIMGFVLLIMIAYGVAWYKKPPWHK